MKISGQILDEHTRFPISFANIYIEESKKGTTSDTSGYFALENICPGEKHLSISHIGCETIQLFFNIENDTALLVYLDHNSKLIHDITISGTSSKATLQEIESISSKEISENSNENLANMLESISGVSTLRTGNSISKPVVHGLYGNRLTILNNGVAQSGQQWGNDHSPEIDPLVANKISVIKGVGALEYQGSSLGSIVLVEPEKIKKDPHLHGKGSYFFESNGLGHGLNLQLQSYSDKLAWKVNGTLKNKGDLRTADYYLNNTGNREANIALQLEKSFSEKWKTDLYFSSFNAKIGVLRGSHIGNLTDLENALEKEIPYFTEEEFSYKIDAPFQAVNHHLLKFHSKYLFNNKQWLDFTYAGQLNTRKEFDVRRSGRTDKPALSLRQISNFFELKYNHLFANGIHFKTGAQFNIEDNTNIPETGILPLIPDYLAYESGAFISANKNWEKLS
ncbi:MAG: TonB-dependent receptor, partial [Chitinophagales bacterium]